MFNLREQVRKLKQLQYDKIHGIPNKPKHYNPKVKQVDGALFDIQANIEGTTIPKGFHNHSADFGRRLSKRKGQYHRPGGGFAGHNTKGI